MSQQSLDVSRSTPGRPVAARGPYLAVLAVAVSTTADLAFDPVRRHVLLCPFRAATGWWCPLCGGLRSAYSLGHGRIATAWHDNAMFVTFLPVLICAWTDWWVRVRSGRDVRRIPRPVIGVLIVTAILFAVVRNLHFGQALSPE